MQKSGAGARRCGKKLPRPGLGPAVQGQTSDELSEALSASHDQVPSRRQVQKLNREP